MKSYIAKILGDFMFEYFYTIVQEDYENAEDCNGSCE